MPGLVRPARAEDAGAVARVRLDCWRETYAHLVSEDLLAGEAGRLDDDTAMWARAIDAGRAVHVAVVDGAVVGLVAATDHALRPGQQPRRPADAARPTAVELTLLYLLAAHHGSGLGQALLEAAIGARACFVWVAEDNPRARAFYARNGFRPDGARHRDAGWEDLAEVRLVRSAVSPGRWSPPV